MVCALVGLIRRRVVSGAVLYLKELTSKSWPSRWPWVFVGVRVCLLVSGDAMFSKLFDCGVRLCTNQVAAAAALRTASHKLVGTHGLGTLHRELLDTCQSVSAMEEAGLGAVLSELNIYDQRLTRDFIQMVQSELLGKATAGRVTRSAGVASASASLVKRLGALLPRKSMVNKAGSFFAGASNALSKRNVLEASVSMNPKVLKPPAPDAEPPSDDPQSGSRGSRGEGKATSSSKIPKIGNAPGQLVVPV